MFHKDPNCVDKIEDAKTPQFHSNPLRSTRRT
jgi:hypothetical protein